MNNAKCEGWKLVASVATQTMPNKYYDFKAAFVSWAVVQLKA